MQQNKHVIPWKCHICGRQFNTVGGGICKGCGQPTCNICFGLGKLSNLGRLKIPETRMCRSCAEKR